MDREKYSPEQIRAIVMEEARKKEEIDHIVKMVGEIYVNQHKILSKIEDLDNGHHLSFVIIGLIFGCAIALIITGGI